MLFSEVSRKQAFLTHLSVSSIIFFVLVYLIIYRWYPFFYLELDGGDRGLVTIFVVDVILGPGLTLLVFKPGKKGLKFDMVMILLFQSVALGWGINSVYSSRPAVTVFYDGKFVCITHDDIALSEYDRLSGNTVGYPVLAFLRRPDTFLTYQKFTKDAFDEGSAEIYVYDNLFETMNESSISRIVSYKTDVDAGIEKYGYRMERSKRNWKQYKIDNPDRVNLSYYPLECRYRVGLAVFDHDKGKIVDYLDVRTSRAISDIKLQYTEEEIKRSKSVAN